MFLKCLVINKPLMANDDRLMAFLEVQLQVLSHSMNIPAPTPNEYIPIKINKIKQRFYYRNQISENSHLLHSSVFN